MTSGTSTSNVQRVGLLVVHGIGEQKRFETAAALARSLAGTLAARDHPPKFSLIDRSGARLPGELACPSADASDAPNEIIVAGAAGAQTHIHIHEVWWSDIGASDSFGEQVQFWIWALGQWFARIVRVTRYVSGPSNTNLLMVGPKFPLQNSTEDYAPPLSQLWFRFLLFLWGVAAFLTFFSWNVVKQVLSWLSPYIGSSSLITQYVGHVRTYTQDQPVGGGSLVDVGKPWRATIRRRMIAELVAMSERGYDRWYLLAHSQGSVLAFNAIQETEWCLPNYLQPTQVERLRKTALWTRTPYLPDHSMKPRLDHMMPQRPVWLADDEGLARRNLFARVGGMLTYGSPLNKFAALWPRIVCLNKQRDVFPAAAGWVNLWDAADPIGACLTAFSDPDYAWPIGGPQNIHVRASPLFLYAHICYLKPAAANARCDTSALLDVILPAAGNPGGLCKSFLTLPGALDAQTGRVWLARLQFVALELALALGAGLLAYMAKGVVGSLFDKLPQGVKDLWEEIGNAAASLGISGYCGAVVFVAVLAIVTVGGCGYYRWINEPKPRDPPQHKSK